MSIRHVTIYLAFAQMFFLSLNRIWCRVKGIKRRRNLLRDVTVLYNLAYQPVCQEF